MFLTKTRVVIADGSELGRRALSSALQRRSGIALAAVAGDASAAKEAILLHQPQALLLDEDLPGIGGLAFLQLLMRRHPMPVIVLCRQRGGASAMACLETGAAEVIARPESDADLFSIGDEIALALKRAAAFQPREPRPGASNPPIGPDAKRTEPPLDRLRPYQAIFIGASTGGTEALQEIIEDLPATLAPIFIVQHIPASFSRSFAERLDRHARMGVSEAEHGMIAQCGRAYVAPGDQHMTLEWTGFEHRISLNRDEKIWHQRPSVDALFNSATHLVASAAVGVILTGMGRDGANGLLRLRAAGGLTIGQDAASSAVYGMPKAAFEIGAVMEQLPLSRIPAAIVAAVQRQRDAAIRGVTKP